MRIHGVLHDLQPVTRKRGVARLADSVQHEDVEPRQLWCGLLTNVDPDHSAHGLGQARLGLDASLEVLVLSLGGLLNTVAVHVELPAVIATADSVLVDHPIGE